MFQVLVIIALIWLCALTTYVMLEFKYLEEIERSYSKIINNLIKISEITDDQIKSLYEAVYVLSGEYEKLHDNKTKDISEDDRK